MGIPTKSSWTDAEDRQGGFYDLGIGPLQRPFGSDFSQVV